MSEVTRMYELLYEERWDEKKQKERRNEAAFFSPESPNRTTAVLRMHNS